MKKIRILFLTILFLLITCNGWTASYYVSNDGDDTHAGTSAAPYYTPLAYPHPLRGEVATTTTQSYTITGVQITGGN